MNLEIFTNTMLKYSAICPFAAPDFRNPLVSQFWFDHLATYSPEELGSAFGNLVTSGKFPSIDAVKAACGDVKDDPDSLAKELSARLREAISRFGEPNGEAAKEWLGDLGWQMVKLCGGWYSLCGSRSYEELGVVLAQGREAMKSVIARGLRGEDMTAAPRLSESSRTPDVVKKLAESTDMGARLSIPGRVEGGRSEATTDN